MKILERVLFSMLINSYPKMHFFKRKNKLKLPYKILLFVIIRSSDKTCRLCTQKGHSYIYAFF